MLLSAREGPSAAKGYRGLLNFEAQPHYTVFLYDFPLPAADLAFLEGQLSGLPTRALFLPLHAGARSTMRTLAVTGMDPAHDYLSLNGLVTGHRHLRVLLRLFELLPRRDLARLELPLPQAGFRPEFASHLLRIVARADYAQQEHVANVFYRLLTATDPYVISVRTAAGDLRIEDTRAWFDVAGRLREGDNRILPAGEVAYAGDRVDGTFVIDGAVLPSPQHPDFARRSVRLGHRLRNVAKLPITLEIRRGRVTRIRGDGEPSAAIAELLDCDDRYSAVTEVGISFNDACDEFVYDWPAASNECRPGVHIAIGGDASPDEGEAKEPLIHLDCMAANVEVLVNGHSFMRTSS